MKKKIKTLLIIIFIMIAAIWIKNIDYIGENVENLIRKQAYGNPISKDGEINNEYFNISDNFENPIETLQGINEAIKYAGKNNIKYIKFKKGNYLIDGTNDTNLSGGIEVNISNITIDLNGSEIRYIDNSKPIYNIIRLLNVENVSIKNGTLIGDKENHDYETVEGSHAFGCGVSINASKNIEISNMKIYNMIGDGIYIGNLWNDILNEYDTTNNCKVINNEIYNCRRLGVAVIGGTDIAIENNEIYNIDGVWPKSGIDIEADGDEKIDNVQIKNNKIYSLGSNYAVVISKNSGDIYIENNELYGGIQGLDGKTKINIISNNIKNGDLYFKVNENLQATRILCGICKHRTK